MGTPILTHIQISNRQLLSAAGSHFTLHHQLSGVALHFALNYQVYSCLYLLQSSLNMQGCNQSFAGVCKWGSRAEAVEHAGRTSS